MQATMKDRGKVLALVATAGIIVALFFLAGLGSIAGAQPDPVKEPFQGVLVDAPAGQNLDGVAALDAENLGPEWWAVFKEDFESTTWEDKWDVNIDLSNPSVGLKWGSQVIVNTLDPSSTKAGWGICSDASCTNVDPIGPSYPKGVNSWLVAGPFDLSSAEDAQLNFDLLYEANNGDPFSVSVSQDRLQFTPQLTVNQNVANGAWEEKSVSLTPFVGNATQPQIWIAFTFESGSSASKIGAMIDDVMLYTKGAPPNFLPVVVYGFTPTPIPVTPTPTATATPEFGGDYYDGFQNNINGWEMRRRSLGTGYDLDHDPAGDGDYQGFLNLLVDDKDAFVIASPLVGGPKPPYNIETVVKLRSPRETGDQYGIVFGGNYDGGACPNADYTSCFTQYYEMRIRYYEDGDKERMDMKLKRIDFHDSQGNNEGPDLIPWTRVAHIDENDFIEWDIAVQENGKISISANDQPVDSATDDSYINNPYFGVIVRNGGDSSDAEAKYDYIKINKN